MKALIDECLPVDLQKCFPGHECVTVHHLRAKGTRDGQLLRSVSGRFDVFLTIDGNMRYQQNFTKYPLLSVIFLSAPSNTMQDLAPLLPAIQAVLEKVKPGQHFHIPTQRL